MNIARNTLINIIDSLEKKKNLQMALRVYGHQSPVPPQDCEDTKLEVHFGDNNASAIRQKLRYLSPKGTTPLTRSLELSINDFPACESCRNIIILITDGLEECKGDPCAASLELQKKGIILQPFIIGIGIDENFKKSFECIGHFYNANSEERFIEVMNIVITQVLYSTTAQVNLLDKYGKPSETNVNMTFYDAFSNKVKYNYIHTINYRGFPDTITLDPLSKYKMVVNTLPPVVVEDIKLNAGNHTIISADCPQGSLIVKEVGGNQFKGIKYSVRQAGKKELINFQEVNQETKYIVGNYDIEIPLIPILELKNVNIKQSHTTTIEIPRPGILNMLMSAPGIASIYKKEEGGLKWVYNADQNIKNHNITILPGNYVVVYRPLNARQSSYSISKPFEIKSGVAVTLTFN